MGRRRRRKSQRGERRQPREHHGTVPGLPPPTCVLLYPYVPRRHAELDARPGSRFQLLDSSDQDWWRLRCCSSGQVGFLPATHLIHISPGERPCLILQGCSLLGPAGEMVSLHEEQVVIELPPEQQNNIEPGFVCVRTGNCEVPFRPDTSPPCEQPPNQLV